MPTACSATQVGFNREARARYLGFAMSPDVPWRPSFRDLGASVTRMATLAPSGRIDVATVGEEIARLRRLWRRHEGGPGDAAPEALMGGGWRRSIPSTALSSPRSSPPAGRTRRSAPRAALFAVSRTQKTSANDPDHLRKYLARFGLDWETVRG